MKAKTVISKVPCKRGHFVRYATGNCVDCTRQYWFRFKKRHKRYRRKERTEEDIRKSLVELLTAQLIAQKERWGFI